MDSELEKKIANAFFYKNFRQRLLQDLSEDRKSFIHKMCHSHAKYMLPECILEKSTRNPDYHAVYLYMQKHGVQDKYYVISEYPDFDGTYVAFMEAIEQLSCNGFASFIVGLPSGFTHFKAESDRSFQPNFYLKPKTRFDGMKWDSEE